MKKLIMSLILVTLLFGFGQVFAQEDNLLGLYFDPYGDLDCIEAAGLAPFSMIDLHLILKNPTFEVLRGFEMSLDIEGPAIIVDWEFPEGHDGLNFGYPGNFIIGYMDWLPMEEINILMTFSVLYMSTDSEGVCFLIGGSDPSSLDPLYPTLAYSDDGLVSANVNNGIDGACTARISETPCSTVATQSQTWDSLKSLYR